MYSRIDELNRLLESKFKDKEIERNTFLIWFGPTVPRELRLPESDQTVDYLANVFLHKKLNPEINVHLVVSKKLMDDSYYAWLQAECEKNKVILTNYDEEYKNCLNHDIIEKFLEDKKDYVCASDILRLSLLFQQGGRYFDLDLKILDDYHCSTTGGHGFPSADRQKYGLTFFKTPSEDGIEFHALEAAKDNPIYLLFIAASKYMGEKLLDAYKKYPELAQTTSKLIRNQLVMLTTGASITKLYHYNQQKNPLSKLINNAAISNFEQSLFPKINNHYHSWTDEKHSGMQLSDNLYDAPYEEEIMEHYFRMMDEDIGNDSVAFFYMKALEYFPQYKDELKKYYPILTDSQFNARRRSSFSVFKEIETNVHEEPKKKTTPDQKKMSL